MQTTDLTKLITLSVELLTLANSLDKTYGGNDEYVLSSIMHLQRISNDISENVEKLEATLQK